MRYAAAALMIGVFLLAGSTTQSFANPALANCRVCGDKVAKEAATCPHCGAPKPWDGAPQTTWYPNGQKESEIHFKNGVKDVLWTQWYKNGQKEFEAHYKNGVKDGRWTRWYEDGQKRWEGHIKDGKRDGLWTEWHENGKKKVEAHFKNGKQVD